jgi:hypothetical protein
MHLPRTRNDVIMTTRHAPLTRSVSTPRHRPSTSAAWIRYSEQCSARACNVAARVGRGVGVAFGFGSDHLFCTLTGFRLNLGTLDITGCKSTVIFLPLWVFSRTHSNIQAGSYIEVGRSKNNPNSFRTIHAREPDYLCRGNKK